MPYPEMPKFHNPMKGCLLRVCRFFVPAGRRFCTRERGWPWSSFASMFKRTAASGTVAQQRYFSDEHAAGHAQANGGLSVAPENRANAWEGRATGSGPPELGADVIVQVAGGERAHRVVHEQDVEPAPVPGRMRIAQ